MPATPPPLPKSSSLRAETEIRDAGFACCVDQDVGGLDVPVNQSSRVGVVQSVGDGGNQLCGIPEGKPGRSHPDREVAAFDELRDDVADTILRAANVVYGHDVGMVELRKNAGFVEKRFQILGLSDALRVRQLDGQRTIELVVVREINPSEAALAQPLDDPVAPDFGGFAFR